MRKEDKHKWILIRFRYYEECKWYVCNICGRPLNSFSAYVRVDNEDMKRYAHISCMKQVGEFRRIK